MAKRYIRVNSGQGWENAPSVATPINKSNLNIMDKGIDDLDLYKIDTDAIANNLVTTEAGLVLDARQGKVLDDKVNTINNNLASNNYKLYNKGTVTTQEGLDAIINDTVGFIPDSIYEYIVDCGTGLTLGVGRNVIRGYRYRANDNYGWQEARTYLSDKIKYRRKVGGTWTAWIDK